jgi:hypothetical protein
MEAPCKNCESRNAECHTKCECYKEFCKEREQIRYERMLEGHANWAGIEFKREYIRRK